MAKLTNAFKAKLKGYFIQKLGAYDYRHGWMKTKACPFCGKEAKFGINLSLNRCNCFRCGEHPSPIDLIMYLEKVDTYHEVIQILNQPQFEGYHFKEEEVTIKSKTSMMLPEGFKLLNQGDNTLARAARNYIKKRGFDIESVSRMGWGYGTTGKYFGYLIIPFHENGKLVYFNARLFIGNGPKYNNPDTNESGLGKSFIIYNKDALRMYNSVFLCEGALNAQTMGERGIASGGKKISHYQVNEILRSPVKRVIILFDSDAKKEAVELAFQLMPWKKVKVIFMPDGKDVNDIGREATLRLIYKERYLSYNELLSLKQKIWQQ